MLDERYELEEVIGEGGMAVVWRARHLKLETPVAVKFVKDVGTRLKERFLREAKIAAAIHHRHVVQVMDFGTQAGHAYMVMELLRGQSLAERLGQGPVPTPECVRIIAQVLSGLCAVHDRGLAHRDIKPENIFLVEDADGTYPKLFDFGLTKAVGGGRTPGRQLKSVIPTAENNITGTPEYMSPEQARGLADIDERTDVWSMGVMLFELLTGYFPFVAPNVGDLLVKILTEDAPELGAHRPDLGPRFETFVRRALERDRTRRFPNARAMREALIVTVHEFAGDMVHTSKQRGAAKALLRAVSAAYEPGDSGVIQLDLDDLDFSDVEDVVEFDADRGRRQSSRTESLRPPALVAAERDERSTEDDGLDEKVPTIPAPPPVADVEVGAIPDAPVPRQRELATVSIPREEPDRKRGLMIAGAALAVLLVGVGVYALLPSSSDPESASPEPAALAEATAAPPGSEAASAGAPTETAAVEDPGAGEADPNADDESPTEQDLLDELADSLTLDVHPRNAEVFVDGERSGRTLVLPDDGETHLVVVRREGYRTWSRRLTRGEETGTLTVRLVRGRATMSSTMMRRRTMGMGMAGFFQESGFR